MENEDIILENDIDTIEQVSDIVELDNSDNKSEENVQSSEESSLESILLRIEELLKEDEEVMQDEEEVFLTSSGVVEPAPLMVTNSNEIDYTDILIQLNNNLYAIKYNQEQIIETNKPHDIFTPLQEFSLSETILTVALIGFGLFAGVMVIKNHVFHLR